MADQATEDSDDDFEHLSDLNLSDSETEHTDLPRHTPATTPPSSSYLQDGPFPRPKKYVCPYDGCGKAFSRPARLEEHIRSHTNERPFKCPYERCSKTYLRDSHLKHHVKSAHTKVRDYKCSWKGCNKSFATGTRLRKHLAAHEGRERYRCQGYGDCSQTFRKRETLERHVVAAHLGNKPFPCPEEDCNKAFDTAEKLRRHQRVNHNPERYSCDVCLEAIEADSALSDFGKRQKHKDAHFATYTEFQIHNSEFHSPTCQYCSMPFPINKKLIQHLEVEHDIPDPNSKPEKRVTCHYEGCNKTYSDRKTLSQHISTKHKNKRFVCRPIQEGVTLAELQGANLIFLEKDTQLSVAQGTNGRIVSCGAEFVSRAGLHDHVLSKHLGMPTRQQLRKKRKAAQVEEEDDEMNNKKSRKPRKDKGKARTTYAADIVGTSSTNVMPAYHEVNGGTTINSAYTTNPPTSRNPAETSDEALVGPGTLSSFPVRRYKVVTSSELDAEVVDLAEDDPALTGEETILENQIFNFPGDGYGPFHFRPGDDFGADDRLSDSFDGTRNAALSGMGGPAVNGFNFPQAPLDNIDPTLLYL